MASHPSNPPGEAQTPLGADATLDARDPAPDGRPPLDGGLQPGDKQRAHPERYGTLTVTRLTKDDGRALILYSHAENEPA